MSRILRLLGLIAAYANAGLAFLMLVALTALLVCVAAAVLGAYLVASAALYLALIFGVPSFCLLLARHINPEGDER